MAPRMVAPRIRLSYELRTQDTDDKHRFGVNAISADNSSTYLYTGGRDGTVRVWDIAHCNGADESEDTTGCHSNDGTPTPPRPNPPITHLGVSKAHTDWVNDLFVTPDGRTVVSCSSDKTVRVTDTTSMICDTSLVAHTDYVKRLAYAPATNGFVSAGLDGTAYLWDLSTISSSSQALRVIPAQQDVSIYALDMDDQGQRIATGGTDRVVRVWDARSQQRPVVLKGHGDNVKVIRFMDNMVLSGASDGSVVLWDLRQHRILHTYYIHSEGIWCLSIAQAKDRMWTSGRDGNVMETTFVDKESTLLFHEACAVHAIARSGADSDTFWVGTTHSDVRGWGYNHNRNKSCDNSSQDDSEKDPLKPRPSMFGDRPTVSHTQQYNTDNTSSHTTQTTTSDTLPTDTERPALTTQAQAHTGQVCVSAEGVDVVDDGMHPDAMVPVLAAPKYIIEGTSGIIKYQLLNAKCKVLSLDDRGHVALWDLLTASRIKDYGQVDFQETLEANFELEFVTNWCLADHNTGTLTIHLDSPSCFAAEVYRDVVQTMGQDTELAQEKINLGYLVIKRLCAMWDPHGRASNNGETAKVVVMGSVPRARTDLAGGWVNGRHVTTQSKTAATTTNRRCSTPPYSQQVNKHADTHTASPPYTTQQAYEDSRNHTQAHTPHSNTNTDTSASHTQSASDAHTRPQTDQRTNGTSAQEGAQRDTGVNSDVTTDTDTDTDTGTDTDTDTDTDTSDDTDRRRRGRRTKKKTTLDHRPVSKSAQNNSTLGAQTQSHTPQHTVAGSSPLLNLEGENRAYANRHTGHTADDTTAHTHTPAHSAQPNKTGTDTQDRTSRTAQPSQHTQTQGMQASQQTSTHPSTSNHPADEQSRRTSGQSAKPTTNSGQGALPNSTPYNNAPASQKHTAQQPSQQQHTAVQRNAQYTQQHKTHNGTNSDIPLTKEAAIKREYDSWLFPPMSGHTPIRLTEVAPNSGIVYFQMLCSDFAKANGCDMMMTNAPAWLKDAVFRDHRPPINDTVKITFYVDPVTTPCQVPGGALVHLPEMPQGNRLSASRALRVRRILRYIIEKVGPALREMCRIEATQQAMEENPGDYLELLCMGKPLLTRTTLGAIKYHLWTTAEDITLHYRVIYKTQGKA